MKGLSDFITELSILFPQDAAEVIRFLAAALAQEERMVGLLAEAAEAIGDAAEALFTLAIEADMKARGYLDRAIKREAAIV